MTTLRSKWRLIAVVWCVAILCQSSLLRADGFPPLSGKELSLVMQATDHPALNDPFLRRVQTRVETMLRVLLGEDARLTWTDAPPLSRWLREHSLDQLTAENCRQFGLDQAEKSLILRVSLSRDGYELSALEYDRHFDTVDRVHSTRVGQRDLVGDALGRLALRCWTPVGELVARRGNAWVVRYGEWTKLSRASEWSRLKRGAVLQLIREVQTADGIRQKPRTDQFLVLQSLTPDEAECELAMPEAPGSNWFQFLGRAQARYLVRRLSPTSAELTARAVFKDSLTPREGCEVSVSELLHGAKQPAGLTGVAGELRLSAATSGVLFVSVQFRDQIRTKVCFPGITPSPVLFQFDHEDLLDELDSELTGAEDHLRDAVATLNDLVRQMNEATKLNDVPRMQTLLKEAERSNELAAMRKAADGLKQKDAASGNHRADRVRQLLADIAQAQRQTNLDQFRQAVSAVQINVLKERIAAAYKDNRWQDAEQLLQEYVQANPSDVTAKTRLQELSAGLPSHNAEHQKARETVEKHQGFTRMQQLLDHWDELDAALSCLLREQDRLWMTITEHEFNGWLMLVNAEAERIKLLVESGTALDQTQLDELTARAKRLEVIGPRLSEFVEKTDKLLAGG